MGRILFVLLWVAAFCSLAYFSLPNYDVHERIDSTALKAIQAENVSRLWFSPSGDLVGYGLNGMHLTARVWAPRSGNLLHERTLELTSPPKAAAPTFAISNDASQIAWLSPAGVHVERLFAPASAAPENVAEHPLRRRVPITSLAFAGANTLAALYYNSELELWDLTTDKVTAFRNLDVNDPGPLLINGSYLATYSLLSHDTFVFDTGSGDRLSLIETSRYAAPILTAALSAEGRLAVGIGEKMEQQGVAAVAPGEIQALAFYNLSRVFTAGEFTGVFLLGPHDPMVQAASTSISTSVVAATNSLLAYGTSRTINLASYRLIETHVYRGFNRPSTWLAIAFLGLITPFAIPLFRGVFGVLLQRILRLRLPEPAAEPSRAADDKGMPSLLVDAVRNGDCVLYAGAGLSAQAGLPLWNAAVRDLANWAAGEGAIPQETATASLEELSRGETGAAADRIAGALAGHEEALHAYLRHAYHVAADLPAAHHLIKQLDFPALVTTALDNLLDRTFPYSGGRVYTARSCDSLDRAAARRDFFLLKPFGDPDEPDTIALGPVQCAAALQANPPCPDFIDQLLHRRTFLFLGASLEGIEQDLGLISLSLPIDHKHYALVAVDGDGWKPVAERLSQRYEIETLTYSPSAPTHPELVDFLMRLSAAVREKASASERFAAGQSS